MIINNKNRKVSTALVCQPSFTGDVNVDNAREVFSSNDTHGAKAYIGGATMATTPIAVLLESQAVNQVTVSIDVDISNKLQLVKDTFGSAVSGSSALNSLFNACVESVASKIRTLLEAESAKFGSDVGDTAIEIVSEHLKGSAEFVLTNGTVNLTQGSEFDINKVKAKISSSIEAQTVSVKVESKSKKGNKAVERQFNSQLTISNYDRKTFGSNKSAILSSLREVNDQQVISANNASPTNQIIVPTQYCVTFMNPFSDNYHQNSFLSSASNLSSQCFRSDYWRPAGTRRRFDLTISPLSMNIPCFNLALVSISNAVQLTRASLDDRGPSGSFINQGSTYTSMLGEALEVFANQVNEIQTIISNYWSQISSHDVNSLSDSYYRSANKTSDKEGFVSDSEFVSLPDFEKHNVCVGSNLELRNALISLGLSFIDLEQKMQNKIHDFLAHILREDLTRSNSSFLCAITLSDCIWLANQCLNHTSSNNYCTSLYAKACLNLVSNPGNRIQQQSLTVKSLEADLNLTFKSSIYLLHSGVPSCRQVLNFDSSTNTYEKHPFMHIIADKGEFTPDLVSMDINVHTIISNAYDYGSVGGIKRRISDALRLNFNGKNVPSYRVGTTQAVGVEIGCVLMNVSSDSMPQNWLTSNSNEASIIVGFSKDTGDLNNIEADLIGSGHGKKDSSYTKVVVRRIGWGTRWKWFKNVVMVEDRDSLRPCTYLTTSESLQKEIALLEDRVRVIKESSSAINLMQSICSNEGFPIIADVIFNSTADRSDLRTRDEVSRLEFCTKAELLGAQCNEMYNDICRLENLLFKVCKLVLDAGFEPSKDNKAIKVRTGLKFVEQFKSAVNKGTQIKGKNVTFPAINGSSLRYIDLEDSELKVLRSNNENVCSIPLSSRYVLSGPVGLAVITDDSSLTDMPTTNCKALSFLDVLEHSQSERDQELSAFSSSKVVYTDDDRPNFESWRSGVSDFAPAGAYCIIGASGSGKTTLVKSILNCDADQGFANRLGRGDTPVKFSYGEADTGSISVSVDNFLRLLNSFCSYTVCSNTIIVDSISLFFLLGIGLGTGGVPRGPIVLIQTLDRLARLLDYRLFLVINPTMSDRDTLVGNQLIPEPTYISLENNLSGYSAGVFYTKMSTVTIQTSKRYRSMRFTTRENTLSNGTIVSLSRYGIIFNTLTKLQDLATDPNRNNFLQNRLVKN